MSKDQCKKRIQELARRMEKTSKENDYSYLYERYCGWDIDSSAFGKIIEAGSEQKEDSEVRLAKNGQTKYTNCLSTG